MPVKVEAEESPDSCGSWQCRGGEEGRRGRQREVDGRRDKSVEGKMVAGTSNVTVSLVGLDNASCHRSASVDLVVCLGC